LIRKPHIRQVDSGERAEGPHDHGIAWVAKLIPEQEVDVARKAASHRSVQALAAIQTVTNRLGNGTQFFLSSAVRSP
jgi:hypothetical protein